MQFDQSENLLTDYMQGYQHVLLPSKYTCNILMRDDGVENAQYLPT